MALLLDRQPVRVGVLLALLCAVSAIAVLRLSGSPASPSAAKPPSAQQMHLIAGWLDRVSLPAGLHADATQTACLGDVMLCVTAPGDPQSLLAKLRSALEARGATMGEVNCASLSQVPAGPAVCNLTGSYRSVPVSLAAGLRRGYPQPSSWAMADASGGQYVSPKPQPLPAVAALRSLVFPSAWRVELHCTLPGPGGCVRYLAHVTLSGSACADTGLLVSRLVAAGFNIEMQGGSQAAGRCLVGAARAFKPGGQDMVLVGGSLKDQPGNVSQGVLSVQAY